MGVEISVTAHGDSYLDGIEEMKSIAFSSDAHLYRLGYVHGFVKVVPQNHRAWFGHAGTAPLVVSECLCEYHRDSLAFGSTNTMNEKLVPQDRRAWFGHAGATPLGSQ